MAQRVLWCILLKIDKGADERRAVGDGDHNADTDCSHIMWREVVRSPTLDSIS